MNLATVKCIISGGAQGLGRHFALRLCQAGAQVAIGDVNPQGLADTLELARGGNGKLHARTLDVSQEPDVRAFVEWAHDVDGRAERGDQQRRHPPGRAAREEGPAHRRGDGAPQGPVGRGAGGEPHRVPRCSSARRSRKMVETGTRPGVVVSMSSIARHGNRGQSNYVAAKAALAANTFTWAREFAPFGVRATAVAPGMIDTPMTRSMNPRAREALVSAIPVGRIGEPEDIWLAVKFCLECEYFNGRTVDVDGGLTM